MGSHVRRCCSSIVAGAIGLGLGLSSARAADDGYDNVFSSVLGAVGVIKVERSPEIEYRERPPLVLPPQVQLPKPVAAGSKRTAAWPQDPDVVKRRKAAEEARAPVDSFGAHREELSKAELLKGRAAAAAQASNEPVKLNECGSANDNNPHCLYVSPDELKRESESYAAANPEKQVVLKAGEEPDRTYLTQPPRGYMAPTRTVKATTEAPERKVDDSNPMSFLVPQKKADDE